MRSLPANRTWSSYLRNRGTYNLICHKTVVTCNVSYIYQQCTACIEICHVNISVPLVDLDSVDFRVCVSTSSTLLLCNLNLRFCITNKEERETDNTTGFSVQSIRLKMSSYMYDTESRLGSSRVFLELPDVTENSLRIASAGSCVSFLNIAMSGFYFWPAISQELKVRETSNFRCKVRWIHTIDEGSHPLPVMYAFCVSASDYS